MKLSDNHWYMPDRYYSTRIQLDATHFMSLIVLDTSPCVSNYRRDNQSHWDPCSTQYPTCSLRNTDDDFEEPYELVEAENGLNFTVKELLYKVHQVGVNLENDDNCYFEGLLYSNDENENVPIYFLRTGS